MFNIARPGVKFKEIVSSQINSVFFSWYQQLRWLKKDGVLVKLIKRQDLEQAIPFKINH